MKKHVLHLILAIIFTGVSEFIFAQCNPQNLVTNSDFENGNTGVSSDLYYNPYSSVVANNYLGAGSYTIGDSQLNGLTNGVWTLSDHTSGSGHALVADGSFIGPMRAWYMDGVSVTPNTDYVFSAWVNDLCALCGGQVTIELRINDTAVTVPVNIQQFPDNWVQLSATWNSGANTTADIDIFQVSSTFNGNDYAIDDIYFGTPFMTVDAGSDTYVYCQTGYTTLHNATVSGGVAPYSYVWSPASGLNNPNSANPLSITSATQTYSVTVTDANGCSATDFTVVNHLTNLVVTGTNPTICSGQSTILNVTSNFPDSLVTWSWSPSTGLSANNIQNPQASPTSTTVYTVTASMGSCTTTYNVTVTVNPTCSDCQVASDLIHNMNNFVVCPTSCVQLTAPWQLAPMGYHYQWFDMATNTWYPVDMDPVVCPTSEQAYYIYIYDQNNLFCDTAGVMVSFIPVNYTAPPTFNHFVICQGDSLVLDLGTGADSYNWTSTGIQNQYMTVNTAGTYYGVAYTCNQALTISFEVDVINCCSNNNVVQLQPTIAVCEGDTASIVATVTDSLLNQFTWYGELDSIVCNCPVMNVIPSGPSTVLVSVFDPNQNCYYTASSFIDVMDCNSSLLVNAGNDVTINVGQQVNLQTNTSGFSSTPVFTWSDGSNLIATTDNLSVTPQQTTTYRVMAQNQQGFATDYVTVFVNRVTSVNQTGATISDFVVYPNPANENVVMKINLEKNHFMTCNIHSMVGSLVYTESFKMNQGVNTHSLDVSGLPSGVYFITLSDGVNKEVKKFIKQ